jgi:ribosomal protein S18 acetylase RimI-like enzyme
MNANPAITGSVRLRNATEEIPYSLLLLADETVEAIDRYVFDSELYLYEHNKRVLAVYVLKIVNQKAMEIKNVAVENTCQGQGIGTFLLQHAAENAARRGFRALFIGTGDNSVRQLAFYQKLGFKRFGTIRGFFIKNYPEPVYENEKQLRDMVILKKDISGNDTAD